MSEKFEYTTLAHRYTAKFPALTYVGIQVNFWIIANILLVVVMYLHAQMISSVFSVSAEMTLKPLILIAVMFGILYGISMGLLNYHLEKQYFRKLSLGKIILFKTLGSLVLLNLVLCLLRFALFDPILASSLNISVDTFDDETWRYLFFLLLIYYFFMALIISFINQVNKKYGPGVLLPLLFGRYRHPREEEKIFMFMDLKSSTTAAEQLGHLKYSSFIRDCFDDINGVLFPFCAQVYQYVGDEIVVMWPVSEGIKNHSCIKFYFACKKRFSDRATYYKTNYGFLPDFKAGVHAGKVTAIEIGEIKKEIAYHGDTLNTSARIQSVCNEYNKDFLVSEYLLEKIGINPSMKTEALGMILLRGKTERVGIVSVDWIDHEIGELTSLTEKTLF